MAIRLPFPDDTGEITIHPEKIIALGLNYRDHIKETGSEIPVEPVLFAKTPNVLIGPEETIVIPEFLTECGFSNIIVHYEAELAVVIGREARNVDCSDAYDFVKGYTCFNDVSQRNIQFNDISGWFRGKSLDTFGPVGPRVVPRGLIPDPHNLRISCRLNGITVQDSNTSNMLFSIPRMISFISRQITLQPGDLIATGTPGGVGCLSDGDVVEVDIESIGVLRNRVIGP